MKRRIFIIAAFLITILFVYLFPANNSLENPETSVWEGYTEESFVDFLHNSLYSVMTDSFSAFKEDIYDVAISVSVEQGWADAEDVIQDIDVSNGAKAYTFTIDVEITIEEGPQKGLFEFFMELDETKSVLKAKGVRAEIPFAQSSGDANKADAILSSLRDSYKALINSQKDAEENIEK